MARIAGVDLPNKKRVCIGLTAIYGVGRSRAIRILISAGVEPSKAVKDLTDEEITRIRQELEGYAYEGALRTEAQQNVRRLIEVGCYRGIRHKASMPVRGQRTRSNARTRKGPHGNMFRRLKKGG